MTPPSFRDLLRKLGYPCIFLRNSEEAAATLFQLIAHGESGFDEGRQQWLRVLRTIADTEGLYEELNYAGANFSVQEWARILAELRWRLEADNAAD